LEIHRTSSLFNGRCDREPRGLWIKTLTAIETDLHTTHIRIEASSMSSTIQRRPVARQGIKGMARLRKSI